MKSKIIVIMILSVSIGIMSSCKKNKAVYTEDLTLSVAENPTDSLEIGTVVATTEKSFITYTLLSESIEGSITVDSKTGKIFVKKTAIFNYEYNNTITAKIECSNGKNDAVSNVTINITDVVETPAVIGEFKEGGVVFWVDPIDNSMGMVCAVSDQSTTAPWGCVDILNPQIIEGADGTAIGTGMQNSIDMDTDCPTSGTASYVCLNLNLNGFSDWFLPSRDEILEMYTNKTAINTTAIANGGTAFDENTLYWTSSEINEQQVYDMYFLNGVAEASHKINENNIRAIRAF